MGERQAITLAVLSDVHLEVRRRELARMGLSDAGVADALAVLGEGAARAAGKADLVIAAGDIGAGTEGIAWVARAFHDRPAVYVTGNHEFYRQEIDALLREMRAAAAQTSGLRFLECDQATFALRGTALRVLGCTLWTDYALYGAATRLAAMEVVGLELLDHKRIRVTNGGFFMPEDALKLHEKSLAWLEKKLAQKFAGITIVVTHHAPIPEGVGPQFQGDALSPGFASDLRALILRYAPALWVHGHTHHNHRTRVGDTLVCSYQWGYPGEGMETAVGLFEVAPGKL